MLHCSPNDAKFLNLTAAQKTWFVLHIGRDKREHVEYIKNICMHIRPEAYFNKDKNISRDTDFIANIEAGLGRELTAKEKIDLAADDSDDVDVDIIERA